MKSLRVLGLLVATSLTVASAPAAARNKLVAATDKAQLVLDIQPATTQVYVDGQKRGTGDAVKHLTLTPGPHIVRLVNAGDEHEDQVVLRAGQKTTFTWKFEDDRQSAQAPDDDYISRQTAAAVQ